MQEENGEALSDVQTALQNTRLGEAAEDDVPDALMDQATEPTAHDAEGAEAAVEGTGDGLKDMVPRAVDMEIQYGGNYGGLELSGASSAVGIDLGTTFSCVSVWRNGAVEIIPDTAGRRTMPSYVAFNNEQRLVGEEAYNQVRPLSLPLYNPPVHHQLRFTSLFRASRHFMTTTRWNFGLTT
jgi:hypothetical protein